MLWDTMGRGKIPQKTPTLHCLLNQYMYILYFRRIDNNYSRGKCSKGRCGDLLLIKTGSNHRQKAGAIHRQMETYTNS